MGDCTLSSSGMALRGADCVRRLAAGLNRVKFALKESVEMSAQFKLRGLCTTSCRWGREEGHRRAAQESRQGRQKWLIPLRCMNNNPVFRRIRKGSNGEVIENIWRITPVKRGAGEVRRG